MGKIYTYECPNCGARQMARSVKRPKFYCHWCSYREMLERQVSITNPTMVKESQ